MARLACTLCATVCGAAVVVGCGGRDRPETAVSAPERLDLGVVGISARIGHHTALGSGFMIDAQRGLVLTSADAVWGARSLKLATAFGVLHGRIVARAPCDDLAVLEVYPRIPGFATLPAAPASSPARGQLVRSVGRRAAAMASIPARVTARASGGEARLDSPLVPEVTGGPVIDAAGRLIGMAQPSAGGDSAAVVPWPVLRARLAELKPGPQQVYVGWADQYRCVARRHAAARAAHPGFHPRDARLNAPVTPTRVPGGQGLDG